jgi:hypothetical protein
MHAFYNSFEKLNKLSGRNSVEGLISGSIDVNKSQQQVFPYQNGGELFIPQNHNRGGVQ